MQGDRKNKESEEDELAMMRKFEKELKSKLKFSYQEESKEENNNEKEGSEDDSQEENKQKKLASIKLFMIVRKKMIFEENISSFRISSSVTLNDVPGEN